MATSYDEGHVGWLDFEPETDTTGDGSGDPDKYILTIADGLGTSSWPEEIAVIVHRTCDGKYPLDGELANQKRHNAQVIVDALNANRHGETFASRLREGVQVKVRVVNVYADGEEVTTDPAAFVTVPEGDDVDEWAEDQLMPLTGTGRTDGDAGYFLTITEFPARPDLVGREFEWGT